MTEIDALESLLVGNSLAMRQLRSDIRRVAASTVPVLVQGPTGAGKELVARGLHILSGRAGPFIALNACAISEPMVEDTLFGHKKGAFTGALTDRVGVLAEANGGTLLLDEIGGVPVSVQMKFLRVVETRVFQPLGTNRDRFSDFRLVTATNDDLVSLAADSQFRQDLLERLAGVVLVVPPLSQRFEDIPLLCRHLLDSEGLSDLSIQAEAVDVLRAYSWPGNVRELLHVLRLATLMGHGEALTGQLVQRALRSRKSPFQHRTSLELDVTVTACEEHGWDITATAASLGVHRATVYRRLERAAVRIPIGRPGRSEASSLA